MNCKHCGRPVVPCNWANGPGWTHKRDGEPHRTRVCVHTYAEPEDPRAATWPAERPYETTLSPDELED